MDAADVKRMKVLELENSRLKKLLAEAAMDIEVLKEINSKKWCARRADVNRSGWLARGGCHSVGLAGWSVLPVSQL